MKRAKTALIVLVLITGTGAWPGTAGWWSLYFTAPGGNVRSAKNPESGLVTMIGRAQDHVYGAFYEITSPRVVEALCNARRRGVDVRIVTESDTFRKRGSPGGRFEAAGVEAVTDGGKGLMHNKFAVFDGSWVWTGSYNPTPNGSGKNDNNAILIQSPELAVIYTEEFMEMFRDGVFGNRKAPGPFAELIGRYHVRIEETDINVYFSPEDNVERIILNRLRKAKSTIRFMAFSFTSGPIGEMLIRKHRDGVDVRGVFERRGGKGAHSAYMKMLLEGVPVKLDRNRHNMHHKVIIIDERRVITGSYNFSRNASRNNDENILIIDNGGIAAGYLAEFRRVYR